MPSPFCCNDKAIGQCKPFAVRESQTLPNRMTTVFLKML